MQGLLVLLQSHKGSEDVALLADDLDLEIDEILPALDFAAALGLLKVKDGRATFTELGQRYVGGTIRGRKAILQEQLRRTTLFRTLLRALDTAPGKQLTNEQLVQVLSMTSAMADEAIQNIVNWGRYAGLIRYDPEAEVMVAVRLPPGGARPPSGSRPPPSGSATGTTRRPPSKGANGEAQTAPIAVAAT